MTRAQALITLQRPIFGDVQCIAAVTFLSLLEELRALRREFHLPEFECPCCEGSGVQNCEECGTEHDCHTCQGSGGWKTVEPYEHALSRVGHDGATLASLRKRIDEFREVVEG